MVLLRHLVVNFTLLFICAFSMTEVVAAAPTSSVTSASSNIAPVAAQAQMVTEFSAGITASAFLLACFTSALSLFSVFNSGP
jgi:hypothetical protein